MSSTEHPGPGGTTTNPPVILDELVERLILLSTWCDGNLPSSTPLPVVKDTIREAANELQRLLERDERMREALADLRKHAALLHQNSVGCATEHYGADFESEGMPGWLADARSSIERATATLSEVMGVKP